MHRHAVEYSTLPQGPSLGFGLSCPEPSSLNRPHPPHSQAHRDFTAWRLIRDAFAVRERLGDPRVVPGFRCPFRPPDMPPSLTPGSSIVVSVQNTDVDIGLRHGPKGSALPMFPQSVSRGARFSGLLWFATVTACQVAGPPGTDLTGLPATGAFTSRLSAGRSPSPLLDMTTTASGLLCWRDFHPQEWQLASLHWSGRAPASPASEAGKGHQRQGARHVSDTQHRDRRDRHRYRQELVPRRGPRCARRHRAAAKVVAWPSGSAARQYAALPDRHGSLRRRTSPEPQTRIAWSRCQVDAGQICPPL